MPFESKAQQRYMFAKHPDIAKRWAGETPSIKKLPEHVQKMAKGGAVKGSTPDDAKVEDHGTHFVVHRGGKSMKVAKNGLSTRTLNRWMGGAVPAKGYAPGGVVSADPMDQQPEDFVAPGNPVIEDQPEGARGEGTPGTGHAPNPTFMDTMSEALEQSPMAAGMAMPATATPAPERQVTGQTAALPAPNNVQDDNGAGQGVMLPGAPVRQVLGMSKAQKDAYSEATTGQQHLADAQSREFEQTAAAREAGYKAVQAADAESANTIKDIRSGLDRVAEEYRNGKIDPQQYWKSKGAAGQIQTALGVLLSGYGQGLAAAGGSKIPNMALELLNKRIEENIDAQKSNLNAKGNEYKMWLDKLGDARQAAAVTHAHGLEMMANQIQTIADRSGSEKVKANAEVAIAAIHKQQADVMQGIGQARADATYQAHAMNWQMGVAQQAAAAKAAGSNKDKISDRVTFNLEAGPKLLEQIEDAKKNVPGALSGIGQRINNDLGGSSIAGDEWDTRISLLAGEAAKLAKGGTPDQEEMKRLLSHAPSANAPQGKKVAYLNFLKDYGKGILAVDNKQFERMGKKAPHDLSQWDTPKEH